MKYAIEIDDVTGEPLMQERVINIIIMFTLSVMAFTLVAFGFDWIHNLWLSEELSTGWIVPFVAIPAVAVISALLIYLFISAIDAEGDDEHFLIK